MDRISVRDIHSGKYRLQNGRLVLNGDETVVAPSLPQPAASSKFANQKARRTRGLDGYWYPSATQARRADQLLAMKQAGEILGYIPECSMPTGIKENGGITRYRLDFIIIHSLDMTGPEPRMVITAEDVKGHVDTNADKRDALRLSCFAVQTKRKGDF